MMYKKPLTKGDWIVEGKYTPKHRVRLFFGIHGKQHDGSYCFDIPDWGGTRTKRMMHSFMFYIGSPLLNNLIGYKELH